jgi:hypothetical protein
MNKQRRFKATVAGGFKNLRGADVSFMDVFGRRWTGTVVTHIRNNQWSVQASNGPRITLARRQFTLSSLDSARPPGVG